MRKEYIKPTLREHKLTTMHVIAGSLDTVGGGNTADQGEQLSKETSFDWGDSWNDDSDQ